MTQQHVSTENNNVDEKESLPDNYLGALDIGSNSFHFVFARVVEENLQILHSEKYQVKLASGLDEQHYLDDAAIERAIAALSDIAPLTEKLTKDNFRVVATYTLRQAKNTHKLLAAVAPTFPFDIEVISGHEEARLIYQGVAHHTAPDKQRLIIDIGGGSTECVIGENYQTKYLTSLNIGCISFYGRFFADGSLTKESFDKAIINARREIESHAKRFKSVGWQEVLGTSGTMKAIYNLINHTQDVARPISLSELHQLKQQLIDFAHVDNINLANLKENRRAILAPGLAILIGIAEMLNIDTIDYCDYSLREGVLYEQLEQLTYKDVRQRTVNSLANRFNVVKDQADVVSKLTQAMFEQLKLSWQLDRKIYLKLLLWAAELHEIGFDINTSSYQKHGRYILENADLPGFNLEQQYALAFFVGNQRKKLQIPDENIWYVLEPEAIKRCLIILRLAILLHQQRQLSESPLFTINANEKVVSLVFEQGWLDDKQLIQADLHYETEQLAYIGYQLTVQ